MARFPGLTVPALLIALTATATFTAATAPPAMAQERSVSDALNLPNAEDGAPMLIQADEMIYDYDLDTVTARGNVEVYYGDYALTANQVTYSKRDDRVHASGNVQLKDPAGNVSFADDMNVTGDFREGFINTLRVVTPDDARIIADSAERTGGNIIVFKNAAYTACRVDETDPERKAPLWQIKSVRVVHNQREQIIEYEDVSFVFAGVPIAYIPYFYHPDPTVKRKSGFLSPNFSNSSQLGFSVETPYFFALAPDYDFTFSPRVTTKQGILLKGEWRQRTENGSYFIRGAGIAQSNPEDLRPPGDRELRGAVESAGAFRINDMWTAGWDVITATDRTFMRVYDLNNRTEYVSEGFLTGLSERNHFDMRVMHLRDVARRETFDDPVFGDVPIGTPIDPSTGQAFNAGGAPLSAPDQPLVHPVMDYNYLFDNKVWGGELGFDVSAYSLSRDIGADSSRVVGQMHWRRTLTDRLGQQFTPFVNVRGDIYQENDVFDATVPGGYRDDETIARFMPTVGMEYSYPFISAHSWGTQIIEPIAQIIARPDETDEDRIANEDAYSLVFDDTVLFETDKFSGYDRVEGGTRANVGIRYKVQTNNWGHATVVLGQSYHLAGENSFDPHTGLGGNNSDFVGGLYLEPNRYFGLSSQFRVDSDTHDIRRHTLKGWVRAGPVYSALSYAKFDEDPAPGIISDREEVMAQGSLKVNDNWRLFGLMRYDLTDQRTVENGIGVGYFCDCLNARIDYTEDYFRDGDDEPNRTVRVQVDLRTLGGTGTSNRAAGGW